MRVSGGTATFGTVQGVDAQARNPSVKRASSQVSANSSAHAPRNGMSPDTSSPVRSAWPAFW
jgi:hypothetical protein